MGSSLSHSGGDPKRAHADKAPLKDGTEDLAKQAGIEPAVLAHIGEPPDREVPGVAVGAALCCLPGATLGALYDDRRVSKEAAVLEKEAYIREAAAQARRRQRIPRCSLSEDILLGEVARAQPAAAAADAGEDNHNASTIAACHVQSGRAAP